MRCGKAVAVGVTCGVEVGAGVSVGRITVTIGGGRVAVGEAGAVEQEVIHNAKIKKLSL